MRKLDLQHLTFNLSSTRQVVAHRLAAPPCSVPEKIYLKVLDLEWFGWLVVSCLMILMMSSCFPIFPNCFLIDFSLHSESVVNHNERRPFEERFLCHAPGAFEVLRIYWLTWSISDWDTSCDSTTPGLALPWSFLVCICLGPHTEHHWTQSELQGQIASNFTEVYSHLRLLIDFMPSNKGFAFARNSPWSPGKSCTRFQPPWPQARASTLTMTTPTYRTTGSFTPPAPETCPSTHAVRDQCLLSLDKGEVYHESEVFAWSSSPALRLGISSTLHSCMWYISVSHFELAASLVTDVSEPLVDEYLGCSGLISAFPQTLQPWSFFGALPWNMRCRKRRFLASWWWPSMTHGKEWVYGFARLCL